MPSFIQDAEFFAAISFLVFFALAFWTSRSLIKNTVWSRIHRVHDEVEQTKHIKQEAIRLVQEAKSKKKAAYQRAEELLEKAKHEADFIRFEHTKKMDDLFHYRLAQIEDRIEQDRVNTIFYIKRLIIDRLILSCETFLKNITSTQKNRYLDLVMNKLPENLKICSLD